jgi:hemerythrin-like domain-containing protein
MDSIRRERRGFLIVAAGGLAAATAHSAEQDKEVGANEDLMREHGVLRRALLVYAEAAARLTNGATDVSAGALHDTAALFRTFGEEYHERSLEEKHVFPAVVKAGGKPAQLASILKQQHDRGREITDYLSAVTSRGPVSPGNVKPLAGALASFVRMYEHHAAIEDTIIFPAWKAAISDSQYEELSEQFEDLEHKMFGKDGFEDALERIGRIEQAFGLADLSRLTAPAPPKPAA